MDLRRLLKEKDISGDQLSRESGIPKTAIMDICFGKDDLSRYPAASVQRLAAALGCSMEQLLSLSRGIKEEGEEKEAPADLFKEETEEIFLEGKVRQEGYLMKPIARIRTDFPEKFGIPRQSGIASDLKGEIVFYPRYRNKEAFRCLEGYSHIWLLWVFSQAIRQEWSPTIRPPWMGGNTRIGVFASRSPYRPNPIGLSCVRLEEILWDEKEGPVLRVLGADLKDGTPILDIKPYLAYVDAHPQARGGLSASGAERLRVSFPSSLLEKIPSDRQKGLLQALGQDPRPAYHQDPDRMYMLLYAGWEIRFSVEKDLLKVHTVEKESEKG